MKAVTINQYSLNEKHVWTHKDRPLNYLSRGDAAWNLRHTQSHNKTGSFSRCFGAMMDDDGLKNHTWGHSPFGSYPLFQLPICPKLQPHPCTYRFPDVPCFAYTVSSPQISFCAYPRQPPMCMLTANLNVPFFRNISRLPCQS